MNLFLIRHAESVNNRIAESTDYANFIATRSFDPEITDTGEKQAEALAAHIASSNHPEFIRKGHAQPQGYGITRMVVSPMLRTLQTAAPTAATLGLPLEVWPDIHEQGGLFEGDPADASAVRSYPGLKRAEMLARFGELVLPDDVTEEGWWRGGYEDYPQSEARAVAVAERLNALAADAPETRLAFVSHGTFLNQLLRALLSMPAEAPMYFFHANTGITRL
jgi:broad specificity phosphatase PhoE